MAGRRGVVVEDDFYNKLEKLNVHAGKRDKIACATHMRSARHSNAILLSANTEVTFGSPGADATTSMENIGEQVYV